MSWDSNTSDEPFVKDDRYDRRLRALKDAREHLKSSTSSYEKLTTEQKTSQELRVARFLLTGGE